MLKTRIISALILAPLVICGVLFLDNPSFAAILGVVLLAGVWEWSHLIPLQSLAVRGFYTAGIAVLMGLAWMLGLPNLVRPLLVIAFGWWLCALLWLSRPQCCSQPGVMNMALKMLAGALVIVPAWASLTTLHDYGDRGPVLTLILMIMVWLADIGAYFAGRQWGRTKLAPAVSPGKTWQGVYGGMFSSLLFATLAGWWFSGSLKWTLAFVTVSLLAVMFSVAGDLIESLMKRHSGIKDSGTLIPGHGGVFDRIDSLVAAAPLFLIGFFWLGL